MAERVQRTLCDECAPPAVELLCVAVIEGYCSSCGVKGKSPELSRYAVPVPAQAQSTAPFVRLIRILELCWRERQMLSPPVVERIREQLEGPLGVMAKADEAVLDAMSVVSEFQLRNGFWRHEPAGKAELKRRGLLP